MACTKQEADEDALSLEKLSKSFCHDSPPRAAVPAWAEHMLPGFVCHMLAHLGLSRHTHGEHHSLEGQYRVAAARHLCRSNVHHDGEGLVKVVKGKLRMQAQDGGHVARRDAGAKLSNDVDIAFLHVTGLARKETFGLTQWHQVATSRTSQQAGRA